MNLIIFLNGITYAGLLFMCASGLTLIFGLMKVVNMSHGIFYLTGAYLGMTVVKLTGNWYLGIFAGGIAVALIAVLLKITLFDRVLGDPMRETLLTLGINLIIGDVLLAVYGGVPQGITAAKTFSQTMNLGFVSYPRIRLFILLIAIIEGIGLYLLIRKTHIGQYIRAGVNDKMMASALGININMVFTFVFILGGLLAGISGVMGGSYLAFNPGYDSTILTYSLVVVIVGGIGSLGGAALGSALVGLIDSYTKASIPNLSMVIIFGVLMLVLAFKPNGLLGREG